MVASLELVRSILEMIQATIVGVYMTYILTVQHTSRSHNALAVARWPACGQKGSRQCGIRSKHVVACTNKAHLVQLWPRPPYIVVNYIRTKLYDVKIITRRFQLSVVFT